MLDWLIVGGGIHGTTLSLYLTRVKHVSPDALRVLDPYERPLAQWERLTRNVGMSYLRSPHVQSLDHDPWSISTFARTRAGAPLAHYIPTHNRPALALFEAHSRWLVEHHGLQRVRVQGRATALERIAGGWQVDSTAGPLAARRVVLAIGATEQPCWPDWAREPRQAGGRIEHVFAPAFDRSTLPDGPVVVVGAGISAAQLALALCAERPGAVTLLARHEPRVAPFDSDLAWIGGSLMAAFRQVSDYGERRRIIREARHTGTMPADVAGALHEATKARKLKLHIGEVLSAGAQPDGGIALRLADSTALAARQVVLATGFDPARSGGAWLEAAIERYALPVAACGYPIPDRNLAWADGLYVTGPLAELEIGPVSRNIIGARFAAERIGREPHGISGN